LEETLFPPSGFIFKFSIFTFYQIFKKLSSVALKLVIGWYRQAKLTANVWLAGLRTSGNMFSTKIIFPAERNLPILQNSHLISATVVM
jgi:hypothetical protein